MDSSGEEEEFFDTNDTFPEPDSEETYPSTTQSNYVSPPEEETPLSSDTRTVSDPCSDPLRGSGTMEDSSTVDVQGRSGTGSPSIGTSANTQTQLQTLLEDLGLKQHYTEKLTLSEILQIDLKAITDEPVKSHSDLPWYFLKKLMMVNVTARNLQSEGESSKDEATETTESDFDNLCDITDSGDMVNPLDVITALFLCSDGFVQQEMALKMSMCQFSVPLLLPDCDTDQCKLMLWAMRDIVKTYRPRSLLQSKGFTEERIVLSEIPMISFVRLGECSMSKSEILNKLLSNSEEYHDFFVHHDMECGDSPRRISNGLTEITWYLPSGKENIDIFSEPLAVANLRGDIASFETQFSFLCQTSAAVFVFFDSLDPECKLLTNLHHKAQMFLVGNQQSKCFSMDALKTVATKLGLSKDNIIIKTKHKNYADFVKGLRKKVNDVIENTKEKMCIEKMADIAHELGILVDEDCPKCQTAKENADAITSKIQNNCEYKATQLPLHGEIWKKLTILEKEEFRLKNLGSEDIETYKAGLQDKKEKLRNKQSSKDMSDAMTCFISAISSPGIERHYFLKWMRMNLDNLSREKLSGLRKQYKEKCKDAENKEAIKDIDKELSNSSLGTEHFFREMGQIYEASVSLPEKHPSREQLQDLPQICAGLLLDGFPLELVDGDASNIPLTWVNDVLSQLNVLVSPKNKILVVTVLGVQSTGKSTLLNTMFGVQFAVSSGRCTRGAFMLLIRINEDVKKVLDCDFMVIIDTEGLRSAELAQLDDSYEHDNELATLVVGLSDITIINIAMENSTQMKDILQIVVHAFLRMKEVGKKPKCQFVHQNVSDVSANENTLRERKLLLDQLNEMTQAAAKMEKKEKNKCFTDVMEYNPETGSWYIPGLWNGNPPMAPVNAGYSEAVYQFKKNITQILGNCESSANDILKFKVWMSSLWKAVKHENFIFSFRNSLVAEAYMKLCTESNNWEWDFKESIYKWITYAETTISNLGTPASKSEIVDLKDLIFSLKSEVSTKLTKLEEDLLEKLKNYFEQKDGHVHLVERYKEDFTNSAKSLRRDMQNSVYSQLTAAAEIKQGQTEVQKIKGNHTKEIEEAVCALIDECQKKNMQMGDKELNQEFDEMWKEIVKKLSFPKQKQKNVFNSVSLYLRINLKDKGSHACELLSQRNLQECGKTPFKYKAKGKIEKCKKLFRNVLYMQDPTIRLQNIAYSIIDECIQYVKEKVKTEQHEAHVPGAHAPEPDAPEADAPEADAPEADAPESHAPEAHAPEADAPEADAPEADAPEADAPEADAPEADAPEPDAPEPYAPEADAHESDAPEADAPEADAPEPDAPEADAPEAHAPEADAPEPDAPEPYAPEADAHESDAHEADAPEADAPEADAPEADAHEADEPEADALEAEAHEADAPEADAHEADAPKADAHEADTNEADEPEADALEAEAHEADAPEADAHEADAPKADAHEADAPEADAPEADAHESEEPEAEAHEADAIQTKDYSDAYIQEILRIIDERLQKNQDITVGTEFEVSLKQHICGIAARHFQKMHEDFLKENDPHSCLNKNKEMFCDSFKDVFNQRDQSQKKAEEFTKQCLKPAVENFVYSKLGPDIIHEMRKQSQFIARVYSQYEILLDLLSKHSFSEYARYIRSYEGYVKEWILDQTVKHLSKDSKMFELVDQHLDSSISSIKAAIHKATKKTSADLKTFINNFCQELGDTLVISQDALGAFMILNKANQEQFAHWFTEFVNKMENILKQKFKRRDIKSILKHLDVNPQNELFTQVIGCGKQCPFCGVACVCGGGDHTVHEASLHRPKGLKGVKWEKTRKLTTDICSSSVVSDIRFRKDATKGEWISYKNYKDIYPDWNIPPDGSYEASDYWKYVMATFNEEVAKEYGVKPADIPTTWKDITRLQAEESLKVSFNMN